MSRSWTAVALYAALMAGILLDAAYEHWRRGRAVPPPPPAAGCVPPPGAARVLFLNDYPAKRSWTTQYAGRSYTITVEPQ